MPLLRPDAPTFVPSSTLFTPATTEPVSSLPGDANPKNKPTKDGIKKKNKKGRKGSQKKKNGVPPNQNKGGNPRKNPRTSTTNKTFGDPQKPRRRKDKRDEHRLFQRAGAKHHSLKQQENGAEEFGGTASTNHDDKAHLEEPFLKLNSFPALGDNFRTRDVFALNQNPENNEEATAWANIAAATKLLPEIDQNSAPSEYLTHDELSLSFGTKMTLLKKDRPSQNNHLNDHEIQRSQPGYFKATTNEDNNYGETDKEIFLKNDNPVMLPEKNTFQDDQPPADHQLPHFAPLKQTARLDMPKLRDRWWDLLQKSAEEKRLHRQSQFHVKLEEEKKMQDAQASFAAGVPQCQEYVELKPMTLGRKDRENDITTYPQHDWQDDEMLLNQDHLKLYTSCAQPLHKAILQHDETALESLLQLCKYNRMFSDGHPTNHVDEEAARWSPLQLAVKLDKPNLLRILLRAVTTEDDQIRRQNLSSQQVKRALSKLVNGYGQYDEFPTPLMLAAELGHEECAQVLLSYTSSSAVNMIACKDKEGNNTLHFCCRSPALNGMTHSSTPSLLRSLLHTVTDAGGTAPSKILSCRNRLGQTSLHVACQQGHISMVETFLDVCSNNSCFSVLMKLLTMQDTEGQTPLLTAIASGSADLVMTLLMWKGNHNHYHLGTQQRQKASQLSGTSSKLKEAPPCCPLLWAVQKSDSADMVRLLLEFHDTSSLTQIDFSPKEEGYDLTHSLHEAVKKSASSHNGEHLDSTDDELLEIVRVLVEAGANPCCERQNFESSSEEKAKRSKLETIKQNNQNRGTGSALDRTHLSTSAIKIAAKLGHVPTIRTLLDSLHSRMKEVHETRRRDPTLRRQPESFFRGLESMENGEMKFALSDGLATTLFLAYSSQTQTDQSVVTPIAHATTDEYLACSILFYRKGAKLAGNGLARLKCSLGTSSLKRVEDVITNTLASSLCGCDYHFKFRTDYDGGDISISLEDGSELFLSLQQRSSLLHEMPWMQELKDRSVRGYCPWLSSERINDQSTAKMGQKLMTSLRSDQVVLVVDNGATRFTVHGSIVSQKSAKLAAAARFARMSKEDDSNECEDIIEIDLGSASSKQCLMLLQHLYHGSLLCGLSSSIDECCQELLDLLVFSNEFLCPSLAKECEMRLLSSNPYECFCWSCCRATTALATGSKSGYGSKSNKCFYIVEGPPRLITPDTALDILAVAQHIGASPLPISDSECYRMEFAVVLHKGPSPSQPLHKSYSEGTSSKWNSLELEKGPLAGLREVTTETMLSSFLQVTQSSFFTAQVEESLSDLAGNEAEQAEYQNEAPALLLQMCLEELATSVSKEAFSVHSISSKRFWPTLSANKITTDATS